MALALTTVNRHPSAHETRTEPVSTRFDRPTMAVSFALFLMTGSFTLAKTELGASVSSFPPRQRGPAKLLVDGSAQWIAEGAAAPFYFWLAGRAGAGTLSAPWLCICFWRRP
jgi:hypothetical protein